METKHCSYLQQRYAGNQSIGSNVALSLGIAKNNKMVQESWDSHHGNLSQQRILYLC